MITTPQIVPITNTIIHWGISKSPQHPTLSNITCGQDGSVFGIDPIGNIHAYPKGSAEADSAYSNCVVDGKTATFWPNRSEMGVGVPPFFVFGLAPANGL